ncbi:hypothetical protein KFK09_004864 [Dendrobium nobile]|uniref:EamA domain-containing protein n=1 Tax=Dendrobium nobile TaxID=94219 RepID=A0A8T3BZD1_DENNO|nr:hypothetical protein KFK09_004864 [Dendrobium nobile]
MTLESTTIKEFSLHLLWKTLLRPLFVVHDIGHYEGAQQHAVKLSFLEDVSLAGEDESLLEDVLVEYLWPVVELEGEEPPLVILILAVKSLVRVEGSHSKILPSFRFIPPGKVLRLVIKLDATPIRQASRRIILDIEEQVITEMKKLIDAGFIHKEKYFDCIANIVPVKKKIYQIRSHIVSRVALNIGIIKLLLLVYRNIIAVVLLAPLAYFLEKNDRPPLTFSILIELFLLALCGIAANQGSYILGLYYLSPTYVSAIQNSTPAITFAMAAALRLEKLNIKKRYGIAKVMGTAVCICGATILTLYKGSPLLQHHLNLTILGKSFISSNQIMHWTLGCVYIRPVPVLKHYPARLSVTTLTCFFGVIQFFAIAAFTERDVQRWKIHSGEELLAVLYALRNSLGLVGSGITFSLQTWCNDRVGPLFVVVFQPVQTVLVAILAAIILGDQLYSRGLIGFILIMVGLYSVPWGKNEENKVGKLEKERISQTTFLSSNKKPGYSAAPGKVKVILYRLLRLAVGAKGESLCGISAILRGCLWGVDYLISPRPGVLNKQPRLAVRAATGSHPTTRNKGVHGAVLRFATDIEARFFEFRRVRTSAGLSWLTRGSRGLSPTLS